MEDKIVVSEENTTLPKVASSNAAHEVKQESNRMETPKISGQLVTDLLKIASVIASISAIFHLFAFGVAAKVNILAYVSLTDFLKVAIVWIAPACFIQVLTFFMGSAFTVFKDTTTSEHKTQSDEKTCIFCEFERKVKKWLIIALTVLDLSIILLNIMVFIDPYAKQIYDMFIGIIFMAWLCAIIWYMSSINRVLKTKFFEYYDYILFIPLLLIISIGTGLKHGASSNKITISDVVSVTAGSNIHSGELLFTLDKFVVVREFDREYITLIPTDKITSIRSAFNLSSLKKSQPKK